MQAVANITVITRFTYVILFVDAEHTESDSANYADSNFGLFTKIYVKYNNTYLLPLCKYIIEF